MSREKEYLDIVLSNDILIVRYISDEKIDVAIAKEIVNARKVAANREDCKLITVFPKLKGASKEARDYFASDDAKEGILANAIVTNSKVGRTIINFYLTINLKNYPDFPIKVFNSEEQAIKWIDGVI